MANIKISELDELQKATDKDLLVIVDVANNNTKKIQAGNLGILVPKTTKTTSDTETYSCNYVNGIIESGSNDNGNWIKFVDGTMICTNRYFIQELGNTTTQSGALFVSSEIQGKSFPVSFTSRPEIFFNFENATWGDKNIISIKTIGYPTTSVAPNIQLVSTTNSTNTAINFEYLAIGKWK